MASFVRTRMHANAEISLVGQQMYAQLERMYGADVAKYLWEKGPTRGTRSQDYFLEVFANIAQEDIIQAILLEYGKSMGATKGGQVGGSVEQLRKAFDDFMGRVAGGAGGVGDIITTGLAKALDLMTMRNFGTAILTLGTASSVWYGPALAPYFSGSWTSVIEIMTNLGPQSLTLLYNAAQTIAISAGMAGASIFVLAGIAAFICLVILTRKTTGYIGKKTKEGILGLVQKINDLSKTDMEEILELFTKSITDGTTAVADGIRGAFGKCSLRSKKAGVACSEAPLAEVVLGHQEKKKQAEELERAKILAASAAAGGAGAEQGALLRIMELQQGVAIEEPGPAAGAGIPKRVLFKVYGPNARFMAEKILQGKNLVSPSKGGTRSRNQRRRSRRNY
jgi:hypothetical protein